MYENLTNDNFLIYAARHYDNPQCHSTDEFLEDIKRLKYVKKLITRYVETGELKERLILNHLIVLSNVFSAEHLPRILYLKFKKQMIFLKPFLIMLNILPTVLYNVGGEAVINTDLISMDRTIIEALRKI